MSQPTDTTLDGIEIPPEMRALINRVAEQVATAVARKTARETREDTIDVLVTRGLLSPRSNVKLETRRQQADYLGMPLSSYQTYVVPLIADKPVISRGDLDKAYKLYQDRKLHSRSRQHRFKRSLKPATTTA